jgi:hypothetical protein
MDNDTLHTAHFRGYKIVHVSSYKGTNGEIRRLIPSLLAEGGWL